MSLGSVVTMGFAPAGAMRLLPTLGYFIGGAGPVTTVIRIRGTDEEIDYYDQRRIRQKREEGEILRVIREFLRLT